MIWAESRLICAESRPSGERSGTGRVQYCGSSVSFTIFENLSLVDTSFMFAVWPSRNSNSPEPAKTGIDRDVEHVEQVLLEDRFC